MPAGRRRDGESSVFRQNGGSFFFDSYDQFGLEHRVFSAFQLTYFYYVLGICFTAHTHLYSNVYHLGCLLNMDSFARDVSFNPTKGKASDSWKTIRMCQLHG
jgi:hypothetical protein